MPAVSLASIVPPGAGGRDAGHRLCSGPHPRFIADFSGQTTTPAAAAIDSRRRSPAQRPARGADAAPSGAANLVEESPDPAAQRVGVTAEVGRRLGYLRRGAAGVAGGAINPGDVLRHVL